MQSVLQLTDSLLFSDSARFVEVLDLTLSSEMRRCTMVPKGGLHGCMASPVDMVVNADTDAG